MTMLIVPRPCRAFTCAPRGAHDSDCAAGEARPDEGFFSGDTESVDSWTPGPKSLCHRHPTGPHPSGLPWTPWTPANGEATSNFALVGHAEGNRCDLSRSSCLPLEQLAEPALSPELDVLLRPKAIGKAPRRQHHVVVGDHRILRQSALQPASLDQAFGQIPSGA